MPRRASEVLPLERLKAELRIPESESSEDVLLAYVTDAAVSHVGRWLRRPLVDEVRTVQTYAVPGAGTTYPARFCAPWFLSVIRVRYWTPGQEANAMPGGVIESGGLGRIVHSTTDPWVSVYPGDQGWPDIESRHGLLIECVAGWRAVPPVIVQAAVLAARLFYDGANEIKPSHTLHALIRGYRSRIPSGPFMSGGVVSLSDGNRLLWGTGDIKWGGGDG